MCIPLAGELVRAVELVLEHHTDEGRGAEVEAEAVKKQAILLVVAKHLGENVVVLQSSKLKLPQSLEDSSAHDISCFLEGKPVDPHARPGYNDDDDEDYLIRPVSSDG
jgi:hypothetical protein